MAKRGDDDWFSLSMRSWQLGMEAAAVMQLRSWRMMQGGKLAEREASRMFSEKMTAAMQLGSAMATTFNPTAASMTDAALDLYGPKIRRNRRRLSH